MPMRLRFLTASTRAQVASGRHFSASSYASASSRPGTTIHHSPPGEPDPQEHEHPPSESQDVPADPPIPETPTSKLFSLPTKKTGAKRPGVKPPPTLALPPSMHPPPPRASPHMLFKQKGETSGAPEKTYDIYLKSLKVTYTEPTLADLDALRPAPSTLRAALDGVIGSGRSLLPEGHALHLADEQLGAQEASVGGGPGAKKTVIAGSKKAKKLEYTALYEATERLVAGGFTLPQLKRLEKESRREMGIVKVESPPEKSGSKQKIIHRIMNSRWNMIHPLVIKGYLAEEKAVLDQVYRVSPSELFIFLGRDGENLLHLSKELKMNITVDREQPQTPGDSPVSTSNQPSPQPGFIIRASGAAGNHKRLKKHLEEQRALMTVRMVVLPTGPLLSPALLQSISRISGAFVENVHAKFAELEETENSVASVLITARNARNAYTAERLVQRAAMEDAHRSQLPLFSLTSTDETLLDTLDAAGSSAHANGPKYALYPFGTHGFRIQRVQHGNELLTDDLTLLSIGPQGQERVVDNDEAFILTGKERRGPDEKLVPTSLKGETIDLRKYIAGEAEGLLEGGKMEITAIYGHITFKAAGSSPLVSPLPDSVSRNSVLEWAEKQEAKSRTFIPGQVPPITHSASDKIISVHRLQYRTIEGGHVVNVTVEIPGDNVEPAMIEHDAISDAEAINPVDPTDRLELTPGNHSESGEDATTAIDGQHESSIRDDEAEPEPAGVQGADTSSNLPRDDQTTQSVGSTMSAEAADQLQEPTPLPTEITVGTETALELLLPDSTMDIYLQVSNVSPLAKSYVPGSLKTYLDELSMFFTTDVDTPQPDPPQHLSIEGKDYLLVKNTSSRYGLEPSITELPSGCVVATEMSLDLENNSRTAFTKLTYDGTGGADGWEGFMHACQGLASKSYERSSELGVNPT